MQNGALEPLVDLVKNCDADGTGVGDAAGAIASLSTLQSGKHLRGVSKVSDLTSCPPIFCKPKVTCRQERCLFVTLRCTTDSVHAEICCPL